MWCACACGVCVCVCVYVHGVCVHVYTCLSSRFVEDGALYKSSLFTVCVYVVDCLPESFLVILNVLLTRLECTF